MNSKIYRCGYCGLPTDWNGDPVMPFDVYARIVNLIEKYGDRHTHKTYGYCCEKEAERENLVQITRDMAIDAGDRSLEGQWIKW